MKERVKNIFCGLGYSALFLGVNLTVSIIALLFFSVLVGVISGMNGTIPDAESSTMQVMDYILTYNSHITVIFQLLTLFLVWFIFKCRRRKLRVEANLVAFDKRSLLPIILLAIAMSFFVGTFLEVVLPENVLAEYNAAAESVLGGPIALQFITTVILAPVVEEIIFRGLVLSRFRKAMPLALAVILSSVTFGLMHNFQIVWICYSTFLGLLMAFVALHEKSVTASIVFHVVFNLFGGFITGLIPIEGIGMVITCIVAFAVSVGLVIYMIKQKKAVAAY